MKKLALATLLVSTTLFSQSGWYLGNTCESIKEFGMKSPLDLISQYHCKPNHGEYIEIAADNGLLAFDCTKSDLKGYMNLIFGKERCILIRNKTKR